MEWWDNIWLNEGFATLFSFLCVDYVRRGDQTLLPHVAGVWQSSQADARSLFHVHINQQHEGEAHVPDHVLPNLVQCLVVSHRSVLSRLQLLRSSGILTTGCTVVI
jgi:hypothetical protein